MYVLAVTGGIGSGKTTAARLFGQWGAVVLDLDDVAKALIAEDGPLVEPVVSAFGPEVRGDDGGVDTAKLAAVAFASPESAHRLNSLVHPGVIAATHGALDMLAAQDPEPGLVVIDVPLLVEAPGMFDLLDGVLAISADEDTRVERLVARGMSEEQARARTNVQASDHERREVADWVIDNDGTLEHFQRDLMAFWDAEVLPRAT